MKSILIVDHMALIRKAIRNSLERDSRVIVCGEAVDGMDALEKAGRLQPDFIILDFAMPRMNGLEVARALRLSGSAALLILFTVHSTAILHGEAENAGISAVIQKSDIAALLRYVSALLMSLN